MERPHRSRAARRRRRTRRSHSYRRGIRTLDAARVTVAGAESAEAPSAGLVSETLGATFGGGSGSGPPDWLATVTLTACELALLPAASWARATSVYVPFASDAVCQVMAQGACVTSPTGL